MSDVRFKMSAVLVAMGLALFAALTAQVEPAQAGFKMRMLAKGAVAAAGHRDAVQNASADQADDGATPDAPLDNSSEPAAGSTAADQPATDTPADATKPAQAVEAPAPVVPPAATAKPASNEKPLPAARPDYYTERAKKTVEQDGKAEALPHPLQAANPDHDVIVCEGGCSGNASAQIVSIEPKATHKPISMGEMIPSSSEGGAKTATDTAITCEAGCYEKSPRSYANIPGGGVAGAKAGMADGGSWVTTVSPVADAGKTAKSNHVSGSGDWMNRITKETGQSAPVSAPVSVAAAPSPGAVAVEKSEDKPAAAMSEAKPASLETAKPEVSATEPNVVVTQAEAPAANAITPASGSMAPTAGELAPAAEAAKAASAPAVDQKAAAETAASVPAVMDKAPQEQSKADVPAPADPVAAAASSAEPVSKPDMTAAPAAALVGDSAPVVAEAKPEASAPVAPAPAPEKMPDAEKAMDTVQVAEAAKTEPAAEQTAPPVVAGTRHDPVVNIETADMEMANAMTKARASLPEFWSKLEQPATGESDFSLKVAISGSNANEVEHFWLTQIMRKDGTIMGTISNEPSSVKTVHLGQRYTINPEKISDWMFKRNGKMVGNETMRPLLKRLPAQQAADYRQMYETP